MDAKRRETVFAAGNHPAQSFPTTVVSTKLAIVRFYYTPAVHFMWPECLFLALQSQHPSIQIQVGSRNSSRRVDDDTPSFHRRTNYPE